MSCISCNNKSNKTYNTLKYCNECFNQMKTQLLNYEKVAEEKRPKKYIEPTEILPNIYIGPIDSVEPEKLKQIGITNIVICGNNLKNSNHKDFSCLELLIDDCLEQDLTEYIKLVNKYIDNIGQNKKVLIHCYSGISRSGSILIAYIMYKNKISYEQAYQFVKSRYEPIFPNENFQAQLKSFCFN